MLKRVVFVAALLLVGGNVMMAQRAENAQQSEQVDKKAQKAAKKAEKEARKAAEEAEAAAAHALAVKALEAQDFVLEASKIEFNRGQFEYVQANANFVMLKGDKATVQLAMNGRFAGPNGMGGFTVDGKASSIEMKTDNDGLYDFTLEEIDACGLHIAEQTRDLHSSDFASRYTTTEYEDKFRGTGKNINYVRIESQPL